MTSSVSMCERSSGDGMECLKDKSEGMDYPSGIKEIAVQTHATSRRVVPADNSTATSPLTKLKEPKFVPYEPYKAAVTPMVVAMSLKHPNIKSLQQCKSLKNMCGKRHVTPSKKVIEEVQLKPCKCVVENQKLEEELAKVREENKNLNDQLKIQTQVNKELKNLLIASVGEDMQAKVQFLTEDKTKLAHDILTYSEKLMEETEAIEKLSIQCDVWRSKYLASSLIVDELAGWKAVLGHHLDEAVETIKLLLQENELHRTRYQNIFSCLQSTNVRNKSDGHNNDSHNKCAPDLESLIQSLHKINELSTEDCSTSKGEQMASKVMAHSTALAMMNEGHLPFENWPMSFAGKFGVASRFHPCTRFEGFTYHCCHCKGEIKIL